ncbi:MAG: ABC transporter permease [Planctomycetota bacterium]
MPDCHRSRPTKVRRSLRMSAAFVMLAPYLLLLLLSLGTGWSFPGLLPDRLDGGPWRQLSGNSGLLRAALTGAALSLSAGILATLFGLLISRTLRRYNGLSQRLLRAILMLPFAVSPVVAGVCLFDLAARIRLAGSFAGVLGGHVFFGTATAAVVLSAAWSDRASRQELLVRSLGGNTLAVWRHVVWPETRSMLLVCLLQTALLSWMDYGIVLQIGGGRVQTLTLRLFALIRESSVNHAALAALLLLLPAIPALLLVPARSTDRAPEHSGKASMEPPGPAG